MVDGYKMQTPQWQDRVQAVTDQLHNLSMEPFVHDLNAFHLMVNSSLDPGTGEWKTLLNNSARLSPTRYSNHFFIIPL